MKKQLQKENKKNQDIEMLTTIKDNVPVISNTKDEKVIESIDMLVNKRNILYGLLTERTFETKNQFKEMSVIEKIITNEVETLKTNCIIDKMIETAEQIFKKMEELSFSISRFHCDLFLISHFLFISSEHIEPNVFEPQMPVIPYQYFCLSNIKKVFKEDEIEKLKNIFFRGLKTFNDLVFLENHFIYSGGTIFFDKYWEDIKKNVKSDIFKIVQEIGYILTDFYFKSHGTYEETIDKVKQYLSINTLNYKCMDVNPIEIGRDKTQYRIFQIKQDVNCDYGSSIY